MVENSSSLNSQRRVLFNFYITLCQSFQGATLLSSCFSQCGHKTTIEVSYFRDLQPQSNKPSHRLNGCVASFINIPTIQIHIFLFRVTVRHGGFRSVTMIVAPDSKTFDGSIPKAYAGLLLKS